MIFDFVVVVINSVQAQDQAEQSLFLPFSCFFLVFVDVSLSTCTNSHYIVLHKVFMYVCTGVEDEDEETLCTKGCMYNSKE